MTPSPDPPPGTPGVLMTQRPTPLRYLAARIPLTAGEVDTEPVWTSTEVVDRDDVARQLTVDGRGAFPWGAVSAAVRAALW
jgi:hypothetical protein